MKINNHNEIIPIFVIGKNRSGTKWLSNILSNSIEIVSLQRKEDYGINETNIFYQFPKIFGDLNSYNNYIPFIECFAQTNIFKLTGLDKQFLYTIPERNYNIIFKSVMNQYAFSKDKKMWLQKSNTYILNDAISYFPNATIVFIERNLEDNIRSTIGLQFKNGQKKKNILKNVFIYLLEQKRIKSFKKKINIKQDTIYVKYEDLVSNTESVLKNLCDKLNIQFKEKMLDSIYQKNTSFSQKDKKIKMLNKLDVFYMHFFYNILRFFPCSFFEFVFKKASRGQARMEFIAKTFEMRYREILELKQA